MTESKRHADHGHLLFWGLALVLCGALLAPQPGAAAPATNGLTLWVGQVKVISVRPVTRVAVGNGSIVSTSITETGDLILLAEEEGATGIHLWYTDGSEGDLEIYVQETNPTRSMYELTEAMGLIPGVDVRTIGSRTAVFGEYDPKYADLLDGLSGIFPDLLNFATPLTAVAGQMLHFHVMILEMNTNDAKDIGIDWQEAINGPAGGYVSQSSTGAERNARASVLDLPGGTIGPLMKADPSFGFFGIATSITSQINLSVAEGRSFILAEPRLSTRSGGKASFLVGGEIPFEIATPTSSSIEFKEVGVRLEIEPILDASNTVISHVVVEASEPSAAFSSGGNRGIASRRAETDINLEVGETLAISGLISRTTGNDIDAVPWLGDIPVIGHLFKSTAIEETARELVILVTPTTIGSGSELNQELVKRRDVMIQLMEEEAEEGTGLLFLD